MNKTSAEWLETFLRAVNDGCTCPPCYRLKRNVAEMQKRIEEDATMNAICKEDEDFKAYLFKTCDMKVPIVLDQSNLGASDIIYLLQHYKDADLLDNTCVTQAIEYCNRLSQVKTDQ